MPISALAAGSALASLAPFFEFFRPTRSPYLLVVLFSVAGLLASNSLFDDTLSLWNFWYALAIPIVIVIVLLTVFVFLHSSSAEPQEEQDIADQHLKFSRSICISTAVLCLVLGCWYAAKADSAIFPLHYIVCICQVIVFTIYAAARLKRQEPPGSLNHFQVALVTSIYLVAMTVCLYFITDVKNGKCDKETDLSIFQTCVPNEDCKCSALKAPYFYTLTYFLFLLLWMWCQYYWIRRLVGMIRISIKEPE